MLTKEKVMEVLKKIEDPEIQIDIVTLGLIYKVDVDEEGNVEIDMTFTSMACPYGPALVDDVKSKVIGLECVKTVDVKITFDPPWKPSEEVMSALGL